MDLEVFNLQKVREKNSKNQQGFFFKIKCVAKNIEG